MQGQRCLDCSANSCGFSFACGPSGPVALCHALDEAEPEGKTRGGPKPDANRPRRLPKRAPMPEITAPTAASGRRADLDWLRVLAILLLVPYHGALVLDLEPNAVVSVKDVVQSPALVQAIGFVHIWHTPLLFAIAGAAHWFAVRCIDIHPLAAGAATTCRGWSATS